jgi:thiol:disulfide interchange protein
MTSIIHISPVEFEQKIQQKKSFVLNIVAAWCSDCTEQQPNIPAFEKAMNESQLDVFQLTAQHEKGLFVDNQHQRLIENLGGHGYPRTILILNGDVISSDNVEIISGHQLMILANKFKQLC